MTSLYQRLNIDETASQMDIRRAYHRLAFLYHPDRNQGDKAAETKFKDLVSAFEILGDQQARALYDQGRIDEQGRPRQRSAAKSQQYQASSHATGAKSPGQRWMWTDAAAAFQNEFKARAPENVEAPIISEETNPGKETSGETAEQSTKIKQYRLSISFVEACVGTVKHVRLPNKVQYKITVPAGVSSGQKLRVKSQSETMVAFLVKISVEPHIAFERHGQDIHLEVPLTPYEAFFGVELDVPTIYGPAKITVPPQAQDGDTITLSHMGIRAKGHPAGDQVAMITIAMPRNWEKGAEAVMKNWQQKAPYNPRGKILNLLAK